MDKHYLESALQYATTYGIPVTPLIDKKPVLEGWLERASTDPESIRKMFSEVPNMNGFGLVPGPAGYVVLDIDVKCDKDTEKCTKPGEHGNHGYDEIEAYEKTYGALPNTAKLKTPSGGMHIWYKKNDKSKKYGNGKIFQSIDIRADAGQTKAYYAFDNEWKVPLSEAVLLPPELEALLGEVNNSRRREADVEEILELCSDTLWDYLLSIGGWGPKRRDDVKANMGYSIQISRSRKSGEKWHEGASIGYSGYDTVHFWTPNWEYEPGKFFETDKTYAMWEIEAVLAGEPLEKQKVGPTAVKDVKKKSFRDFRLTRNDLKTLPKPEYLIDKHLVRNTTSMLFSPYGVGKSFLALDWALSIVSGTDWLGHKVRDAEPVVYIVAEGAEAFDQRVCAWEQEHGVQYDPEGSIFMNTTVNIANASEVERFMDEILKPDRPALIIVDTLARCTVGTEENSAKEMGMVIHNADMMREVCGSSVLFIHHTGHATNERYRGSSSVGGSIHSEFSLTEHKDKLGLLNLRNLKQKDDEKNAGISLIRQKTWLEDGRSSCVLVPNEEATKPLDQPNIGGASRKCLDALWSIDITTGVDIQAWRTACGAEQQTHNRHKNELLKARLVTALGDPSKRDTKYKPTPEKGIAVNMSNREANA